MYFIHQRHYSPSSSNYYNYHPHQQLLINPSFAYLLANPEELCRSRLTEKSPRGISPPQQQQDGNTSINRDDIQVLEETDRYLLYTDLPGVKVHDLRVEITGQNVLRIQGQRCRRADGEAFKTFYRECMLDEDLMVLDSITANLSDGVLQIVVPKKQTSKAPLEVVVVAGDPGEEEQNDDINNNVLCFEVDVPGVRLSSIQVLVHHDGKLEVSGERKRAGKTELVHKALAFNPKVVNISRLEAFLENGVLSIRGPQIEPFIGLVIPVTSLCDEDDCGQDNTNNNAEALDKTSSVSNAITTKNDNSGDKAPACKGWKKGFLNAKPKSATAKKVSSTKSQWKKGFLVGGKSKSSTLKKASDESPNPTVHKGWSKGFPVKRGASSTPGEPNQKNGEHTETKPSSSTNSQPSKGDSPTVHKGWSKGFLLGTNSPAVHGESLTKIHLESTPQKCDDMTEETMSASSCSSEMEYERVVPETVTEDDDDDDE